MPEGSRSIGSEPSPAVATLAIQGVAAAPDQ